MTTTYDVIIIGTGAGGGTLAYRLAASGKKILLLERGDFAAREKQNWDPDSVFIANRYTSKDTWYDSSGKAFQPGSHYFVGGATKVYGAALYRLRQQDFGEIRHYDGVSPAWPIEYQDLEPYYTKAERVYHVHGERGADPTEPPASAPYPYPAVSHEPRIAELHDALRREGIKAFHAPSAIMLDEERPAFSRCIRCETCDGYPCLVQAKADAEVVCVRPALEYPNVTLIPNSEVVRLKTSASGREVTEVVVRRRDEEETYSGDVVVVSAGAANSARILLLSANDRHPRGLANGSDMVGRNYMFHNNAAFFAISRQENPTRFQKTLAINDFYFGDGDFGYPLGNIQMLGKTNAAFLAAGAPRFAPEFSLEVIARHALDFWLMTEDLPDPNNRVTLNEHGQIVLSYAFNNQEPMRRLIAKLKSLLKAADCHPHLLPNEIYMGKTLPIAAVGHQAGTCRFGTDPKTSVLDRNCRAHELDNLYVVDTSFFPSIGAVNPSLTAMANALRVGDHILERLG
jgi:choline dehydrogenase-like flavoprotein